MRISAIIVTMICMVASALNTQGATNPSLVFGTEVEVVNLSVSVTDKNGKYVENLASDDFFIYENSVLQKIQAFEKQALPLRVLLLIDASSSMNASAEHARAAASRFIETLRPIDQAAVASFHRRPMLLQEQTSNHELLKNALMRITEGGETTRLYDSIRDALRTPTMWFGKVDPASLVRRVVILITDGEDIDSMSSDTMALEDAMRSDITVYAIMIPRPLSSTFERDYFFLRDLSEKTGGMGWSIQGELSVRLAYKLIQQELKMQYRIGYVPTHAKDPGPRRSIVVQIRGGWDTYTLRYRTGYQLSRHP